MKVNNFLGDSDRRTCTTLGPTHAARRQCGSNMCTRTVRNVTAVAAADVTTTTTKLEGGAAGGGGDQAVEMSRAARNCRRSLGQLRTNPQPWTDAQGHNTTIQRWDTN
eukprot:gene6682-3610_t